MSFLSTHILTLKKKPTLIFFYTGTLAIVLLCHICMLKASSVICKVTPSLYCLKNYTHYFQFSMFFLRIKEVQTINHSKSGPSNKHVMCWCVSIITVCFQFQNKSRDTQYLCLISHLYSWFIGECPYLSDYTAHKLIFNKPVSNVTRYI